MSKKRSRASAKKSNLRLKICYLYTNKTMCWIGWLSIKHSMTGVAIFRPQKYVIVLADFRNGMLCGDVSDDCTQNLVRNCLQTSQLATAQYHKIWLWMFYGCCIFSAIVAFKLNHSLCTSQINKYRNGDDNNDEFGSLGSFKSANNSWGS